MRRLCVVDVCVLRCVASEHLAHAFHSSHESVHFFLRVVESERRTHRALYAETVHNGLCAVVTGAHGDAESVEQRAHVEMMYVAHEERHHGVLALGGSEESPSASCSSR